MTMKKRERASLNLKYKKITHAQRIQIIYMNTVHQAPVLQIEAELGIKYNSIRNILHAYQRCGRTNKKKYQKLTDSAGCLETPEGSEKSPLVLPQTPSGLATQRYDQAYVPINSSQLNLPVPSLGRGGPAGSLCPMPTSSTSADFGALAQARPGAADPTWASLTATKVKLELPTLADQTHNAPSIIRESTPITQAGPDGDETSKGTGLLLYTCQGPATNRQAVGLASGHDNEQDYGKLFVCPASSLAQYPYLLPDQGEQALESIGEKIGAYQKSKQLCKLFTGSLKYLNRLQSSSRRKQMQARGANILKMR